MKRFNELTEEEIILDALRVIGWHIAGILGASLILFFTL